MTPDELRTVLVRTWGPLLARHGRPNEAQLAAAGPIFAGRDVLLMAPTAAGKTEAVLAPLVEKWVEAGADPDRSRILWVSPTRALCNDLARRLSERLDTVGVRVGRWTGEHHDGGALHPVTVITPEGLDSRLSRAPRWVEPTRALVLDELHALDGSARGDQLRVLVERFRVRRTAGGEPVESPQVIAASATVADPEALAGRYLRDPVLVTAGLRRPIRARIEEGRSPARIAHVLAELAASGGGKHLPLARKVLVFCNSREEVETLARHLHGRPPFGRAVFAHHGSLARGTRLSAEERFLSAPAAAAVCTSTMELGVDIGDVDLVALVGVPPDVAALVQRAGRGGRRTPASTVVAFVSGPFEESEVRSLLAAQKRGQWFSGPPVFRPGVLVQQAISILHERSSRTVDAAALHRRLPPDLADAWPPARLQPLLARAAEREWLARVGTGPGGPVYALGARGERNWSRGTLHGNLGERTGVAIVDALTGDEVGKLETADGGVDLGGRGRRRLSGEAARVVTEAADSNELPTFGGGSPFVIPAALATGLLCGAGIGVPSLVRLPRGDDALFHGLGSAGGALIGAIFEEELAGGRSHPLARGVDVRRAGRLALVFEGEAPEAWPGKAAVDRVLRKRHASLARKLAMGAHHFDLPTDEQRSAVAALCEADRVRRLLEEGAPSRVEPADPELWDAAAWA